MTHFIRSVSTVPNPSYKIGISALLLFLVPKPGLGNEKRSPPSGAEMSEYRGIRGGAGQTVSRRLRQGSYFRLIFPLPVCLKTC